LLITPGVTPYSKVMKEADNKELGARTDSKVIQETDKATGTRTSQRKNGPVAGVEWPPKPQHSLKESTCTNATDDDKHVQMTK
jgi:hypothetical protein